MRLLPNRLQPYRRLALDLLLVACVTAAVITAAVLLNRGLVGAADIGHFNDAISIVQLFATAVIVIAGAGFAYRKLQLFRDFEPHLTVT